MLRHRTPTAIRKRNMHTGRVVRGGRARCHRSCGSAKLLAEVRLERRVEAEAAAGHGGPLRLVTSVVLVDEVSTAVGGVGEWAPAVRVAIGAGLVVLRETGEDNVLRAGRTAAPPALNVTAWNAVSPNESDFGEVSNSEDPVAFEPSQA